MFKLNRAKAFILLRQIKSPLRLFNDLGMRLSYFLNLKYVPFQPSSIDIEPVNSCNFRCPHCQVTYWDKVVSHIQIPAFEMILNQLPLLIWVKLQGMGEPMLNRDLFSMLELGEKRNIHMQFTTNGSLLKGDVARQISKLKNTSIHFSIDGASAEVFQSIRVGSRFDIVCENIKNFAALVEDPNQLRMSAWMVLTKKNVHEAKDVVRLVKQLGINVLTLQPFLNNWGKEDITQRVDQIKLDPKPILSEEAYDSLDEVEKAARQEGVDLKVFKGDFYSESRKCSWPWRSAYICANGDVVPCAILADSDTVKMGNIYEQEFKEIWNSNKYQLFRERHIRHELPKYCQHCYLDCEVTTSKKMKESDELKVPAPSI